jgi:two-component system phosphate regulon sensor histidine kinase PhoR
MAAAIEVQLRTIQRQLNEQDAVLQSMMEGVLAVDNDERLLRLNAAAARLLRVDGDRVQGRPIQEVIRNVELQRFIARLLASRAPQEGEVILRDEPQSAGRPNSGALVAGERFMQAHGTVLRDEQGRGIGALVVLNDVTRLRRLETVRREFVANVSHELKTPITSIKGFVETLLDGAWQNPDDARRFLEIVAKQSERLNAIIEDLLVLSSLEQETTDGRAVLGDGGVCEVLQAAVQVCAVKAAEKGVAIAIDCPAGLRAPMNAPLIEQAVVNLIDNAVKYSESGQSIDISARTTPDGLVIRVRDHGAGIAPEHVPRLFERFYRVDRGRSRQQGGTGLGLAIVKHIAKAHGGTVTVESKVGEGSTFEVTLPAAARPGL